MNTLIQRFGRTVRDVRLQGVAILIAESQYFYEEQIRLEKAREKRVKKRKLPENHYPSSPHKRPRMPTSSEASKSSKSTPLPSILSPSSRGNRISHTIDHTIPPIAMPPFPSTTPDKPASRSGNDAMLVGLGVDYLHRSGGLTTFAITPTSVQSSSKSSLSSRAFPSITSAPLLEQDDISHLIRSEDEDSDGVGDEEADGQACEQLHLSSVTDTAFTVTWGSVAIKWRDTIPECSVYKIC